MKQDTIDYALGTVTMQRPIRKVDIAWAVYSFLSLLIEQGNYLERQVLRTVRGMVKTWIDNNDGGSTGGL